MSALIPSLLAACLYLGGTLYQIHCQRKRSAVDINILRLIGVLALLAHAGSLYLQLFVSQGLSLASSTPPR